ncbi:glycoside hydrolase family 3 C-terminal domain-containing protein [Nitrospirillum amazonense]|uniref:glycoside hydrolase family 3 C-terminal domain-containing protein n=1 Tax=Nitrospirillum amazonense TaxID=28077 RepID=UPI002DD42294|nr:glycoside hydrolase family 3 C-terminal domain-containing protein [Nitrospirillum amazonense]MEC4594554.1 glycoside hydrolase family 3 C-terminal domain-containing protein [Nitrospirillum amazonense]
MGRSMFGAAVLVAQLVVAGAGSAHAQEAAKPPYLDPSLPVERRVDDLVGRLTPEEKAAQLTNQARAIPRLNIPAYNWWSEALHGVARNGEATVFPEPIGLAATFDPAAIRQMGIAIGTEARVKFNRVEKAGAEHRIYQGLDFWSPNINIFRDPRWGRGQETYGEDPYLTGKLGTAFVQGMQGDDPKYYRVIATAKHYAVHSGPEPTRHEVDVAASRHDMEDTYLPAFRELVTAGKVASVMCAYNRVNGQPACASDFLLTDQLRKRWGFTGYVVSDCDAIADIQRGHHYTKTLAEAAAVSLKLGVDNDCTEYNRPPDEPDDFDLYRDAIAQGLVSQDVVDTSLRRLFTARMRLGLFDPPASVPYAQVDDAQLNSPEHVALALRLANESMVLLKNNGVLPVKPTVKTIAVIGPLADQVDVLLGNYNGQPIHPVTALDGIRAAFPNAQIVYEPGSNFLRSASTIPASALSGPDGKPGLKGEYWGNPDFSGAPTVTRTDGTLNLDRDMTPVVEGAAISARWTGFVTVPVTGEYNIGLSGANATLWVEGAEAVKNGDRQRTPQMKALHFEAGRRYAIRIDQTPAKGPVIRLVWNPVVADPLNRAVAAAKAADLVVAVAGISSALEGEEMTVTVPGFKGGDRTSLDMPAEEENLLKAVKATGKPMALVLMNGSALSVNWAAAHVDAIIDAWYPGEQGGMAIGQTLSGVNNPSGRLPVTFYKGVDGLPPFEDYSMRGRTYRYFTGTPLYAFGHGLSYTTFAYTPPALSAATLKAGETLGVDAQVRNAGAVAGDEVVQLYLGFPQVPGAPIRALRAFSRVHLAPGESKKVHFDLDPRDLSSVTEAGDRVVAGGAYTLTVGGGQPGTGVPGATAGFTVVGTAPLAE